MAICRGMQPSYVTLSQSLKLFGSLLKMVLIITPTSDWL